MHKPVSHNSPAPYLALAGALGLAACQWLIFSYAPVESEMKLTQKIFYVHLPLAWGALLSFFTVFAASIAYLWEKKACYDACANAAAELGVIFAGLALVTGAIWARKAWGVWWTWEPRLTTTLVLWFIYAAYLVLGTLEYRAGVRAQIQAVVGIIGFLDVPLVFFATRLQKANHPVGTMSNADGLEPEMRLTIYACLAATALFWAGLLLVRYQQKRLQQRMDRLRHAHEQDLSQAL